MAKAPGQPVLDDVTDVAAARGNAGDRRDMIGLERMLHAQQETETQNCEHACLTASQIASNTRLKH